MSDRECTEVRWSRMAFGDGEEPLRSAEQVRTHLEGCSECQKEVAAEEALHLRLVRLPEMLPERKLWAEIAARIGTRIERPGSTTVLAVFGIALLILRAGILVNSPVLAWSGSAAALLLCACAFWYVGANPFKLQTEP